MKKILQAGTLHGLVEIPEAIRKVFVTAHDITPEWHVRMQAVFQKYTDNAVSKTVNFPHTATQEDVRQVFIMAQKEGCKGVTVYRDGSRDQQVLSTGTKEKPAEKTAASVSPKAAQVSPKADSVSPSADQAPAGTVPAVPPETHGGKIVPRSRPAMTRGGTMKVGTGCGNFYVTINEDEKGLFEVFAHMGKSGGCAASQTEAISRLISLALRSGVEVEAVLKQLKGIRCPAPLWDKGDMVLSCPDAIGKAISRFSGIGKKSAVKGAAELTEPQPEAGKRSNREMAGNCPDCGGTLEYVEDCVLCRSCGYSKCG
jgi:ribonucleoside-diphosphate reductase alpha chain